MDKKLYSGEPARHEALALKRIRQELAAVTGAPTEEQHTLSWLVRQYDYLSEDNHTLAERIRDLEAVVYEYEARQPVQDER